MTIPSRYVGCDVSKRHLDIFDPAEGRVRRLDNTPKAARALARALTNADAFLVYEATSVYDRVLARALAAAQTPSARVNPTAARRFAQARGRRAKTDALDAVMLAELGARLTPPADAAPDPARERLAALAGRRDQLVAMRAQEKNRLGAVEDAFVRGDVKGSIARLDKAVARLDAEIAAHAASVKDLAAAARLLISAPGVGPVTAMTVLALMPELGRTSPKKIAALAGLAPYNNDSGALKGRRAIAGGRARVRRALYMAALASLRRCANLRAFYDRVAKRAASKKIAVIAVARKLLTRLNAMIRDQKPYEA